MKSKSKIIVITGAESTGKTTLTESLAKHFDVPYMPEIAREYIEKLNHKYTFNDVEIIGKMQIELFEKISNTDAPYIFMDTWLIVTKIWFEFVYNETPGWLVEALKKYKIDLFLVCDTDLPWIDDPVRENGGETRNILQEKYIQNIVNFGFHYKIVNGKDDKRFENAIRYINELQ